AVRADEVIPQAGILNDQVMQRSDGTRVTVQVQLVPIKTESGFMMGGISRDITDRKRAEQELFNALEESRKRGDEVAALLGSARTVLRHGNFKEAAQEIISSWRNLIGASYGIALLTADGNESEIVVSDPGEIPGAIDHLLRVPIFAPLDKVYRSGEVVVDNIFSTSQWAQRMVNGHVQLDNVLFAPLIVKDRVVGFIGLNNKPGGFSENDLRVASAFADIVAVAYDNSRTLASLETSEERFRSVVQTASDAVVSMNSAGNIAFWNQAAEILFGYSAEEVLGKPLTLIMPERFREPHQAGRNRAKESGAPRTAGTTLELAGLRKDGAEFPLELSLAGWQTTEGLFFTGTLRDITERKAAQEALRESEERYRQLVELSPDAIGVHSEGRVVFANTAGARVLGAENSQQLIGKALTDFVHPDSLRLVEARVQRMKEGVTVPLIEEKFVQLDGTPIDVEVAAMPLTYQGRPAMQVVFRDVTQRKRTEDKLRRREQEVTTLLDGLPAIAFFKD
ncbi:MAG: PAS domain S-box protein, partial [Chloroflexi bacterium]|nr:PAS domain S-box protein [Chloroflexota bacterium]